MTDPTPKPPRASKQPVPTPPTSQANAREKIIELLAALVVRAHRQSAAAPQEAGRATAHEADPELEEPRSK